MGTWFTVNHTVYLGVQSNLHTIIASNFLSPPHVCSAWLTCIDWKLYQRPVTSIASQSRRAAVKRCLQILNKCSIAYLVGRT